MAQSIVCFIGLDPKQKMPYKIWYCYYRLTNKEDQTIFVLILNFSVVMLTKKEAAWPSSQGAGLEIWRSDRSDH